MCLCGELCRAVAMQRARRRPRAPWVWASLGGSVGVAWRGRAVPVHLPVHAARSVLYMYYLRYVRHYSTIRHRAHTLYCIPVLCVYGSPAPIRDRTCRSQNIHDTDSARRSRSHDSRVASEHGAPALTALICILTRRCLSLPQKLRSHNLL